ncbi:MAG TPA: DUF3943 domain-containing protein, partial [Puia sp.]|nr:DUF3943 domain-containing protein [Puia sp.]
RPAWLWASIEAIPWTYDKVVVQAEFANISWKTVGYNLQLCHWSWDDDGFVTNQLAHPAHGSLFFNSFRSNGYNFWQSTAASFAGSYVWETFSEKQAPAPNDFINTGFGGMVLGEMINRFSNKIIDNGRRGIGRQVSEIFAFIINPTKGLSRIIDGKWGKVLPNSPQRDSSWVELEVDAGIREFRVDRGNWKSGLYGHLKIQYGSPYENYQTPFSHIYLSAEFGEDDSSKVNVVSAYGSLRGWRIAETENSRHLVMLTANYDFIDNEAFFYSAQSVKVNLFSEYGLTHKIKFSTVVGAGSILLAAVPNQYSYAGRNYDYCTGVGFNGSGVVNINEHLYLTVAYRGGWFTTLSGTATDYFLHTVSGEISYRIMDGLSICAEPAYFRLHGNYGHDPDIDKTYPYLRISLRYGLRTH